MTSVLLLSFKLHFFVFYHCKLNIFGITLNFGQLNVIFGGSLQIKR